MGIIKNIAGEESVRISWYAPSTELLGPFKRFVLWVQGCERNCRGCIAREMQPLDEGKTINISELSEIILHEKSVEGITVSGGEPFYQADKILSLIRLIKLKRPDFGVIIYTGYTVEELRNSGEESVLELLENTDILIDSPYIEELDDNSGLRGSSNQRVISLSKRYRDYMDQYDNPSGRKNSFVISGERLQMIGVPSQTAKDILKQTGVI